MPTQTNQNITWNNETMWYSAGGINCQPFWVPLLNSTFDCTVRQSNITMEIPCFCSIGNANLQLLIGGPGTTFKANDIHKFLSPHDFEKKQSLYPYHPCIWYVYPHLADVLWRTNHGWYVWVISPPAPILQSREAPVTDCTPCTPAPVAPWWCDAGPHEATPRPSKLPKDQNLHRRFGMGIPTHLIGSNVSQVAVKVNSIIFGTYSSSCVNLLVNKMQLCVGVWYIYVD